MLQKIGGALLVVGGIITSALKIKERINEASLRLTKSEIELITHPAGFPADDGKYQAFIADFAKERRTRMMFRRSIPNSKLGPLMDFYRQGQATIQEIGTAWHHHQVVDGRLSFRFSPIHQFWIWVTHFYALGCSAVAVFIGIGGIFAKVELQEKLPAIAIFLLLIGVIWAVYWSSSPVFIARKLAKIQPHQGNLGAD